MAAHREWTERHIRELVQSELKKLKKPVTSGFTGVLTANRNIKTGVTFATERILSNLYMSDEVININPDELNKDLEYKSFYYEMKFTGDTYYDGKLVFGVMPCNDRILGEYLPIDIPIYKGLKPTVNPGRLEGDSYGNLYSTMYAYQDGKFFSIKTQSNIKIPGKTNYYEQYYVLFFGLNPDDWSFEHSEWKDKFSNWSEYDFSREKHYLYMEFGYDKEV